MLGQLLQRQRRSPAAPPAFRTALNDADIRLTPAAAAKMRALMAAADDGLIAIRVFVMGGGCNGLTYSMTYIETLSPYDSVLAGNGFQIAVDAVALNYLRGCTIDYAKQGLNESFVFRDVFQSIGGSGNCSGCGAAGRSHH
ncbi:MAG: iron-sulfur cluster assembly accessory protein [Gammaproteobacteria bacterium]